MIRINLLGVPKTKKARRGPAISVGGGANVGLIGALLLLIVLGGNWWYYKGLNDASAKLQADLARAKTENATLAMAKTRYQERQKQFDLYDHRVKVIHQLQSAQTGPLDLMNTIASTVNGTDAVWLASMNDDGNNVNLTGTALSATAVANLLSNLKKTNYFKNVELKETYQDESVRDLQAFQFTITCEKTKS